MIVVTGSQGPLEAHLLKSWNDFIDATAFGDTKKVYFVASHYATILVYGLVQMDDMVSMDWEDRIIFPNIYQVTVESRNAGLLASTIEVRW